MLVVWITSEDEKKVPRARTSDGVVREGCDWEVGGGRASVVDGSVVLRGSICRTEREVN